MGFVNWLFGGVSRADVIDIVDKRVAAALEDLETNSGLVGRINQLEVRMAAWEDQLAALDAVTTDLGEKWEQMEEVNAALRAAVQAGDTTRAEALAAQADAHAALVAAGVEKLRAIGVDADNPVPDTEPLPSVEPAPPVS